MSTATHDRLLYAVPAPPQTQERFAFLLALRRRAQQALDVMLALPRGAAGWALRHLQALVDVANENRILAWAGAALRRASTLARGIGVVPLAAALLSTPPVWRAATGLTRAAGSALLAVGRGLWHRVKKLLQRGGTTGARVARALAGGGRAVAGAAQAVASHPAAEPVTHAVRSLARLVRPLSHSLVAHRVLGLLVPSLWARVALELIALPLLLAPALPATLRSGLRSGSTKSFSEYPENQDTQPEVTAPAPEQNQIQPDEVPDVTSESTFEPRNRAERRAQQQEQARARRTRARH